MQSPGAVVGLTLFLHAWDFQSFTACCPMSEKHSFMYLYTLVVFKVEGYPAPVNPSWLEAEFH